MADSLKIFYNNKDIFSGIAPTPYVSFSDEFIDFGNKWNQVVSLTLNGQLTGNKYGVLSYYSLNDSVNTLLSGFNENYKSIQILSGSSVLYSGSSAIINSINIDKSNWYGILPFTINMTVYETGLFTNYYGIVEPEETFSFSEENGGIANFEHSISAKGIVTSNKNAIENAKEWVLSRTGLWDSISPILIKNDPTKKFLLLSTAEVVDRFNGIYSWKGSYTKNINLESPSGALLNYTIDLSSGFDEGFINASINGSLEGNNITGLRSGYYQLNLYELCNNAAIDTYNTVLSNRILEQSTTESPNENKLEFNASFNNDYTSDIINNYNVGISYDNLKCITSVSFQAEITAKYGDVSGRWLKVKSFYDTGFFPYDLANTDYQTEITGKYLNINPLSESITFDQNTAKINYSAQYTDKKISFNSDILTLSSNATYSPSVSTNLPQTSAYSSRQHNVQNLVCASRASIKASVTATAKLNSSIAIAQSVAQQEVNRIISNYLGSTPNEIFLDEKTITKNKDINSVTINESWSFNGEIF